MPSAQILQPRDLGLILSYKCQSNCAHCLYNCGRGWEDWINKEDIEAALTATLIWKYPFQVHITGGEPFLNFPLLKHAVKICVDLDIPVYLETNAGWCVDEDLTYRRFAELHDLGLGAVQISCSPFHAETIPPQRVISAIEQAGKVFSPQRVFVYMWDWLAEVANKGTTGTVPLQIYIDEYGHETAGRMFWQGYSLISGGRAGYRLGHLAERYQAEEFKSDHCLGEMLFAPHSHFDLYGNFIPGFCGGISLGRWRELDKLIQNYQTDRIPTIIEILMEHGPYGLYEQARECGYAQLPDGYAGKCHLCVDLRRHLHAHKPSPQLQPEGFYANF
jgi:hypothetical protein